MKRSHLIPLMRLFDGPDGLQGVGLRPSTTIAPQALAMMNNRQVRRFASDFARRLLPTARRSPADAIRAAYEMALGRGPAEDELSDALDYLRTRIEASRRHPTRPEFVNDSSLVLWLDASDPDRDGNAGNNPRGRAGLAAWRDKRSKSTLNDAAARDGKAPLYVVQATPLSKPAVRFVSGRSKFRIANHASLNPGKGDFTLTVLFRLARNASTTPIIGKDNYPGTGRSYTGFFLQYLATGQVRFATRNVHEGRGNESYLDSSSTIGPGQWCRVTGVRKSGVLSMHLHEASRADAKRVESGRTDVSCRTDFKVGGMDDAVHSGLQGDIAEVLFYRRALDPGEIRKNHAYLNAKYLGDSESVGLELALVEFCQALFCLNEFLYVP